MRETLQFVHQIFPLRTCKLLDFQDEKMALHRAAETERALRPACRLVDGPMYRERSMTAASFMEGEGETRFGSEEEDGCSRWRLPASKRRHGCGTRSGHVRQRSRNKRSWNCRPKTRTRFGLYREGNLTQVCILFVRNGKLMGSKKLAPIRLKVDSAEILSSVLKQYYQNEVLIPEEILIAEDIEDREVIAEWISDEKGAKISIEVPQRGNKKGLLDMARDNADNVFKTDQLARENREESLKLLAQHLHLKKIPEKIECLDISNVGGHYAVGSMVTFTGGLAEKSGYRRFKIQSVQGMDDYAMMYEVLKRRYAGRADLPDLLMVDGGKGQLNVALAVARELGIEELLDMVGIAKENREGRFLPKKTGKLQKGEDRVYTAGRKDPIYLSRHPRKLFLLQRVRDEAHRFAIAYHRKLKARNDFRSVLTTYPASAEARKMLFSLILKTSVRSARHRSKI